MTPFDVFQAGKAEPGEPLLLQAARRAPKSPVMNTGTSMGPSSGRGGAAEVGGERGGRDR